MKTHLIIYFLAILVGTVTHGLAQTDDFQLSPEDTARFQKLYRDIRGEENVRKARLAHEHALAEYHRVLRTAMLEKDPSAEPILRNIRMSLASFVESVWKQRDEQFMRTLNYSIQDLGAEDSERWKKAMSELRNQELFKAFRESVEAHHRKQDELRREHNTQLRSFQAKAREAVGAIDPALGEALKQLEEGRYQPATTPSAEALVPMPADDDLDTMPTEDTPTAVEDGMPKPN